jgi:hypothetical protein
VDNYLCRSAEKLRKLIKENAAVQTSASRVNVQSNLQPALMISSGRKQHTGSISVSGRQTPSCECQQRGTANNAFKDLSNMTTNQ